MIRVIITGDRHWHCARLATYIVERLALKYGRELIIVHGAAKGVDSAFADAAYEAGVAQEPHKADWDRYGPPAGPKRNTEMIAAGADLVIAVHRDLAASKGTMDCARQAFDAGIPVWHIAGEDVPPRRIVAVRPTLEYAK